MPSICEEVPEIGHGLELRLELEFGKWTLTSVEIMQFSGEEYFRLGGSQTKYTLVICYYVPTCLP